MLPMISPFSSVKLILKTLFVVGLLVGGFAIGYYVFGRNPPEPPQGTVIIGEPVVMRTKGGLLEVSKVVSTQSITKIFPGLFLDRSVTITVPATYRYHVELAPEWKFMRQDNVFVVVAPPIKPSMPVAINTAEMAITTNLPFGDAAKLQAAQQITPTLNEMFPAYMARQRGDARKTIAEFVTKWVLEQDQDKWKSAKDLRVVVLFPDESVNEALKIGLYPVPVPKEPPQSK